VSVLGFRSRRIDPDPPPTTEPDPVPLFPADPNPDCICRNLDGHGQNPTCPIHPWWRHDPHALHLADLTRELGSAWAAARQAFGGGA